jgi:hypothetical protein
LAQTLQAWVSGKVSEVGDMFVFAINKNSTHNILTIISSFHFKAQLAPSFYRIRHLSSPRTSSR